MDSKVIGFDDTEIEKYNFYQHKKPILIDNIDVNKIVASNEVFFGKKGFKCFLGCKDAKKIRPLYIFLSKMITYRRDKTKCMSILIKDENFLEKYDEIWQKISNSIKNILIHNKK